MAERCFTPTQSFRAVIKGSLNHYIQGGTYTIREGYEELRIRAQEWAIEGKVKYVPKSRRPISRILGSVRSNNR